MTTRLLIRSTLYSCIVAVLALAALVLLAARSPLRPKPPCGNAWLATRVAPAIQAVEQRGPSGRAGRAVTRPAGGNPEVLACPAGSVVLKPGDNLQAIVNAHPPGTTYCLTAGIYRQVSIVPHARDTYVGAVGPSGERKSILNGSLVVSGFERSGANWRATVSLPPGNVVIDPRTEAGCEGDSPRCKYLNELFLDGRRLKHVARSVEVGPGTWFLDTGNSSVCMGDDPEGHVVELSVTPWAFNATLAPKVTLKNLVVEKYATNTQGSAIGPGCAVAWNLDGAEFRLNHSRAACIYGSSVVRGSYFHHQGQLGLTGVGNQMVVERNEISHNNEAGYLTNWEAGGLKSFRGWNLVIQNNYVHDNRGSGLWTDYDNQNSVFESNRTFNNNGGISAELSFDQKIRYNVVESERPNEGDPTGGTNLIYGGSITSSDSRRTEIYGNTVVSSAPPYHNGIVAVRTARIDASPKSPTTNEAFDQLDLNVHDNVVVQMRRVAAGAATYSTSPWGWSRNRFANNFYKLDDLTASRFGWSFGLGSKAQWLTAGQDTASVWIPPAASDFPSTALAAFDRVQTLGSAQVRSLPSTQDPAARLLGTVPAGAVGYVTRIRGPIYSGAEWWWQVQYDGGLMGWSRQQDIQKTTARAVPLHAAILAPAEGEKVSGPVLLSAAAASGMGVGVVEFYVDGQLLSTELSPPYGSQLDTASLENGTHLLTAKAYDTTGNVMSSPIRFEVSNAPPAPPVSILQNGDFEMGGTGWQTFASSSASFWTEPGYAGHSAVLRVGAAGSNLQLYQSGLVLEANTAYRLTFMARSPNARAMAVTVVQHGAPYANYGLQMSEVDLTPAWTPYLLEFTTTNISDKVSDGRLMFWFAPFASAGDEYWFDDVVLIKIPAGAVQR